MVHHCRALQALIMVILGRGRSIERPQREQRRLPTRDLNICQHAIQYKLHLCRPLRSP
ncbi:hypothetical protein PR003_g25207 [Phytophthora rubi]|uniref:Uncharacterized protein n=1 Tax=Phytophthora rubi TaxID=129364 RepID=A0A6A3IF85_9STRA|nr:hypothetical protein PR002_g24216 [Phytophthora rubi]KAE8981696.1 hypothetical protein PR001_g23925 [Phytophthora rubi]KAE9290742.1 hypothetical protein PR003_g25207 [Phytophthora rubi]